MRLNKSNKRQKDYKMVSDRSGLVYPASQIVRQWDGLLVAKHEEEPRHPQEFVRGVVDDYVVRNPRPRQSIESTLSSGSTTISEPIIERDGDFVISRIADAITTRGEPFGLGDSFYSADLGSVRQVNRVVFQFDEIGLPAKFLNIYTSEDGVTYNRMETPFVDIIRSQVEGEETSVMIGRRARYLQFRFEPISGQIDATIALSKFDVIGGNTN